MIALTAWSRWPQAMLANASVADALGELARTEWRPRGRREGNGLSATELALNAAETGMGL